MNIIVIGGGIAGIAAAWGLNRAGAQVTLVEQQPFLGGRLCSYRKNSDPSAFDNGPHLFLSNYTQSRRLLRETGLSGYIEFPWPGTIPFSGTGSMYGKLQEWILPAPLNLAAGLMDFRLLSWEARKRLLYATRNLLSTSAEGGTSIESWLREHAEDEERILFWDPLIGAALNCPSSDAPLRYLRVVFKQGFCKGITGGRLGFCHQPLGWIFNAKMRRILEEAGIRIRTRSAITGAGVSNGHIGSVTINEEEPLKCDGLIAALPPWALRKWLHDVSLDAAIVHDLNPAEWRANSISSVYLWARERPLLEPFTCTPDAAFDWVFDFGTIWKQKQGPLALLMGNKAGGHASLEQLLDELILRFPRLKGIRWQSWRRMVERRATPLRPPNWWEKTLPQNTNIDNLHLAGDWLDPDLPPTIEAAVRSGIRAADMIIES